MNDPERFEQLFVKPIDETEVGADFDGQAPARELYDELSALGVAARLIGGADEAAELDAARAIAQGPSWRCRCSPASPELSGSTDWRYDVRRPGRWAHEEEWR